MNSIHKFTLASLFCTLLGFSNIASASHSDDPLLDAVRTNNAAFLAENLDSLYRPMRDLLSPFTLLHQAIEANAIDCVPMLTRKIAINTQDGSGWTPLHVAALWGRLRALKKLLDLGANPFARDFANQSVLHAAMGLDKTNELRQPMIEAIKAAQKKWLADGKAKDLDLDRSWEI